MFKRDLSEKGELRIENKLFCSQYAAEIYNSIGFDLKKKSLRKSRSERGSETTEGNDFQQEMS